MDTNQIENLLDAIKDVCPFDISILSTRRRILLMVIKYPYQENFELNEWAVAGVRSLHWDKINPLIKKYSLPIRCLYCYDNNFVLFSPDLGRNILYNVEFPIDYNGYGFAEYHNYVGGCLDIKQLISFLTQNTPRLF